MFFSTLSSRGHTVLDGSGTWDTLPTVIYVRSQKEDLELV